MQTVQFTQMRDGTKAEYDLLHEMERHYIAALPDRILGALRALDDGLGGYRISRLQHSLQAATRAERDGADSDWVVAALVHDIGDVGTGEPLAARRRRHPPIRARGGDVGCADARRLPAALLRPSPRARSRCS